VHSQQRINHGGAAHPAAAQGLTFVYFSARPEPFLTQNTPWTPHLNPLTPTNQPLNSPFVPQKALMLSQKVDECNPLPPLPPPLSATRATKRTKESYSAVILCG
jgi:hypothetical protein